MLDAVRVSTVGSRRALRVEPFSKLSRRRRGSAAVSVSKVAVRRVKAGNARIKTVGLLQVSLVVHGNGEDLVRHVRVRQDIALELNVVFPVATSCQIPCRQQDLVADLEIVGGNNSTVSNDQILSKQSSRSGRINRRRVKGQGGIGSDLHTFATIARCAISGIDGTSESHGIGRRSLTTVNINHGINRTGIDRIDFNLICRISVNCLRKRIAGSRQSLLSSCGICRTNSDVGVFISLDQGIRNSCLHSH